MPEEELRRSLLQPEEVGLQQQGAEPDGGFQHADLLGKHQFFRMESCDRLIMFEMTFKGGEDLSDGEHEAFSEDAPAEFVGGAGD